MKLIEKIRKNLKSKMDQEGLSMRALSLKANLQEGAVKNIFNMVASSPGINIICKLADVLDCSIDELCGRTPKETTSPIHNKQLWVESVVRVDDLIKESKKDISPQTKAELYLACYEFNTQGIEIKDYTQLNTIIKFMRK
jgi:transcriptional regulator with XRE-family HTH domain